MPGGLQDERLNKATISVSAGSPTTVDLPADRGYIHQAIALLKLNGVAPSKTALIAAMPKHELIIDGQVYSEYYTSNVLMLEAFYGEEFIDGQLPSSFAQESRDNIADRQKTSFLAQAYRNPKMRYYIHKDADTPTLEQLLVTEGIFDAGRSAVDAQPARGVNSIIKHYTDIIDIVSSGATPTRYRYEGGGDRIRGFHFKGANITAIKILWDEQERWFFLDAEQLNARLRSKGGVPQANWWHVAWETLGGSINAALNPTHGNQRHVIDIEIFTSDEENVDLLVEQYNKPPARA